MAENEVAFFERFRRLSEAHWEKKQLNPGIYGFQVQPGSKWRPGLDQDDLDEFQDELQMAFPPILQSYFATMNGLDKPSVNIFGSSGHTPAYGPSFYSYPDDTHRIRQRIQWVCEANAVAVQDLGTDDLPAIFPIHGHRFLILHGDGPVLSMYGDDIIQWAGSLQELLVKETFSTIPPALAPLMPAPAAEAVPFWFPFTSNSSTI